VGFQDPYRGIPISLRKARELGNSSLLLRTVGWRHFVLALLFPTLLYEIEMYGGRVCDIVGLVRGGAERGGKDDMRRRG
jgi:hypothetical protein